MSRNAARRDFDQEAVDADYRHQGMVVNLDGRVPIDESGAAYKPSAEVIEAIIRANLAEVEHSLWPLASLKAA